MSLSASVQKPREGLTGRRTEGSCTVARLRVMAALPPADCRHLKDPCICSLRNQHLPGFSQLSRPSSRFRHISLRNTSCRRSTSTHPRLSSSTNAHPAPVELLPARRGPARRGPARHPSKAPAPVRARVPSPRRLHRLVCSMVLHNYLSRHIRQVCNRMRTWAAPISSAPHR